MQSPSLFKGKERSKKLRFLRFRGVWALRVCALRARVPSHPFDDLVEEDRVGESGICTGTVQIEKFSRAIRRNLADHILKRDQSR